MGTVVGTPATPCEVVTLTTAVSDADVADLMAQGYLGDPTDSTERLYSPSCAR
jgi:hypothetical protein